MNRRFLLLSTVFAASTVVYAKGPEWQNGEVAAMDVIRTPVGKKIAYRYSYTVHGNGYSYSFD